MNFSNFFIQRPIFAAVLSLIILIGGGISLFQLPVSEYPEVVPPTVVVTANYPGANPTVIAQTVATPLEQEINGTENMLYMFSQGTSDGRMTLTVTFALGTDLDRAQVQVQNRVNSALPRLPEEVQRLGVVAEKSSPDLTMVVHLYSPNNTHDTVYLSNYADLNIKDEIARLPGVGDIRLFGGGKYSMRVWLNPDALAARKLTAGDVITALRSQNQQVAAGSLGAQPISNDNQFQILLNVKGRLNSIEEFEQVIIKIGQQGQITRLKDVARLDLGQDNYSLRALLDGQPALAMPIFQRPGSNAIELSETVLNEDLNLDGVLNNRTFRDSYRGILPTSDNDPDLDGQDGYIVFKQTVKVIDDVAPLFLLDCDVPDVCITNNTCGGTVTFQAPVVEDCVDASLITVTASSELGLGFGPFFDVAPGIYNVVFQATDNCGNSETFDQIITIEDNTNPVITCPSNQMQIAANGTDTVLLDYTSMATVSDNCSSNANITVTQSPAVGSTQNVGTVNVTLTATDECGNTSNCNFDVDITNTTGIVDNTRVNITIFPNPNNGLFTVHLGTEMNGGITIQVYNLLGEIVYNESKENANTAYKLDLQHVEKGIYYVSVKGDDKSIVKKIMIM